MIIPEEFVVERVKTSGRAGQKWIDELPALVERLAAQWQVELSDEEPGYGAAALVVFGERRGEPLALKVCWPEHDSLNEAAALRAWNGRGIVRLLEFSQAHHALLLERLDRSRSLNELELPAAANVVGGLIRQLAVPAPDGTRRSTELTAAGAAESIPARQASLRAVPQARQASLRAVPQKWAYLAVDLAERIAASDGDSLIHTDLHSDNVLAADRGPWLAVDPRPSIGHPEQSVPDLLLWRLPIDDPSVGVTGLLDTMISAGDLDAERAYAWTIIRAVTHWLWCQLEDADLPPGEPRCTVCAPRSTRILEALT